MDGVVRPETSVRREKRIGRIRFAVDHQTTGTFQADIADGIPAKTAVLGADIQRIFFLQKFFRKSFLAEIRKIIPIAQANANGIDTG